MTPRHPLDRSRTLTYYMHKHTHILSLFLSLCMYKYTYINKYIYIYMYITYTYIHIFMYIYIYICLYIYMEREREIYAKIYVFTCIFLLKYISVWGETAKWYDISIYVRTHEVATISRLHKIIGLFCKRALQKRLYSVKNTTYPYMYIYICKKPIHICRYICV